MPSTAIRFISYDEDTERLSVTFVTGRRYVYERVPKDVFEAFLSASSRGGYFNSEIRDRYEYRESISRDSLQKALGLIRLWIAERRRTRHHFGQKPSAHRPERQPPMRVAEIKPQVFQARRLADHRP